MDGSRNVTITYENRTYYIIYVGIHGGSGMGANFPYNGRYYLVTREVWEKKKDNYCMVHDLILPKAWGYYEKNGVLLCEEETCPNRITESILSEYVSRLDLTTLKLFGSCI